MDKIATYLDEVAIDPKKACEVVTEAQVKHICLRTIWNHNIMHLNDEGCKILRTYLQKYNLSVLMLATECGLNSIPNMATIERIFNICTYFKAGFIRFYATGLSDDLIKIISEKSLSNNVVPIIEPTYKHEPYKLDDIVNFLNRNRRWRILYDPSQYIIKQAQKPFDKQYLKLDKYVSLIDIHDYKIGVGHKPAGFGDAQLKQTLEYCVNTRYAGWYIIEPSLGLKHGVAANKSETFLLALDAFKNLVNT